MSSGQHADQDIEHYEDKVTCDNCGEDLHEHEGIFATYMGQKYVVCSEECEDYIKDGIRSEAEDRHMQNEDDYLIDGVGFADPGGRSALRAATPSNPRDQPCPTCGAENVLTRIDVQRGYQCDRCADRDEGIGGY